MSHHEHVEAELQEINHNLCASGLFEWTTEGKPANYDGQRVYALFKMLWLARDEFRVEMKPLEVRYG